MNAGKPHHIPTGRLWDYLDLIETQDAETVVAKIKEGLPKKKDNKGVLGIDWERVEQNWKLAVELQNNPDAKTWLIKALLADIDSWHATVAFWKKQAKVPG